MRSESEQRRRRKTKQLLEPRVDTQSRVEASNGRPQNRKETETQAQAAYRLIEEMIVTLRLAPGSLISEKVLSQELSIGRTPVREALARLSFEGTVKILPRAGAMVSEIDISNQIRMIEVRREIEKILAGRSARLADAKTCADFAALAKRFDQAAGQNDADMFLLADGDYNALVAATAQNIYAVHAIGPIEAQTRRFWYFHYPKLGGLAMVCKLHAVICRAIAVNDEPAARSASDALLDHVEVYTRSALLGEY